MSVAMTGNLSLLSASPGYLKTMVSIQVERPSIAYTWSSARNTAIPALSVWSSSMERWTLCRRPDASRKTCCRCSCSSDFSAIELQADVIGASSAELQGAEASFDVGSNGILVEDYEELLQNKAEKIREQLNGTCIFLIGMMGSGKTTVGRVLSKSLGYYFFDSDELVEQAAGGTSVAQIFEESDEEGFRKAETEVLRQLSALGRLVVATGGGAVIEPHNWGYLRHGIVVWLNVPLDALAKRVTAVGTESRPLLPPDAAQHQAFAHLSKLLEQRGAAYGHADATVSIQVLAEELGIVDYSEITPTMIALQVLEEIDRLLIEKERKMPKVHY
ncbi:hypothetical protein BDL97_02G161600 [Sphagnum fallax]|nr:hypothetical protein BDL97_02G161600 [Sphagnum fallax]KAH8971802.1 hypothetical protein BDL97_02G161600 [Sphagnum fallax]